MKGEWTIISDKDSSWPICLGRHQQDESSPVWVWGDWKLALEICKQLNKNIKTPRNLNESYIHTTRTNGRAALCQHG